MKACELPLAKFKLISLNQQSNKVAVLTFSRAPPEARVRGGATLGRLRRGRRGVHALALASAARAMVPRLDQQGHTLLSLFT